MRRALVPLFSMLLVQIACSAGNLSLASMMPAVAPDVGIGATLIGAFTALSYGLAATTSLAAADPVARFGTVRICQLCLVATAGGLAVMTLATPWALILGVAFVGLAQGPVNTASSAVLARRTPTQWYSTVFTIKQTGVPLGFALAGLAMPALVLSVGWQGAALVGAGVLVGVAVLLQPLHGELESDSPPPARVAFWQPMRDLLAHRQLRAIGFAALLYVTAQHSFTFVIVTYLVQRAGLTLVEAGAILAASQIVGSVVRLAIGGLADMLRDRLSMLGIVGLVMGSGVVAVAFIDPTWPRWGIYAATLLYGASASCWNGVAMGETARWSAPGQAGAMTSASTCLTYVGGVVGPASVSALVGFTGDWRLAFGFVLVAVLSGAVWLLVEGAALRRQA